jgi:DNA-binding MarR family transcriptional regulator
MGLALPSASKLVDGLIVRGLMSREEHPADRRRVRLTITRRGLSVLRASRTETLTYLSEKLKDVGEDEREVIVRAMETLRTVFPARSVQKPMAK